MVLTTSQKWYAILALAVSIALIFLLRTTLTPFLIGGLLAYLGDPLADRLEDRNLSRSWAVTIVFAVMFVLISLVLLIIVPLLQDQVSALIEDVPGYVSDIQSKVVPWLEAKVGFEFAGLQADELGGWINSNWAQAKNVATAVLSYLTKSGTKLLGFSANVFLVPVITFYMLRDWDRFMASLYQLLPEKIAPEIAHIAKESDSTLGAFLRGQLTVMLALSVIYTVGLMLVGLKFALLIGILAGIVSFVPYLGLIVGIVVAGIAVFLQTHSILPVGLVVAVFVVGQMIEGMLLTPLLVGDRIGLHPVAVMFAVLAGGQLFGFFGILLALPVAAVLAVIIRDLHRRYKSSAIYRDPSRQLALDEEEANTEQEA